MSLALSSGFVAGTSLDLLLPFSELFLAESGIVRREMEAAAAKLSVVPESNKRIVM